MSAGSHVIDEKILGSATILVEKLDVLPSKRDIIYEVCNKIPIVVLDKIDVTPYLCDVQTCKLSAPKQFRMKECLVNVVNDNLTELKATLTANLKAHRMIANDKHPYLNFCTVCYKTLTSLYKLQKHLQNKHMIHKPLEGRIHKRVSFSNDVIVYESLHYERCRKCGAFFNKYKDLRAHMHTNHRRRQSYVCTYCTKVFADRKLFKTHVKLHCNLCGTLATDTNNYIEHKRSSCCTKGVVTNDVKCKDTETPEEYSCVLCIQKFKSKCFLRHHVSFVHENIKPMKLYESKHLGNDKMYICKYCGESSVDRDTIEKHVAILPDLRERIIVDKKDYACLLCPKRFESENELTQHNWSHFLTNFSTAENRNCATPSSEVNTTYTENPILLGMLSKPKDRAFYATDVLPRSMQPIVLVERLKDVKKYLDKLYGEDVKETAKVGLSNGKDVHVRKQTDTIVIKKKTMYSKYQCNICLRYYSTKYCLRRHKHDTHFDIQNLRCRDCEEVFFWPSLLYNHKCLRWSSTDVDYGDSRPDVQFTNMLTPHGHSSLEQQMKDLTISEEYSNDMDFEMPAPIVEFTEYDENYLFNNSGMIVRNDSPRGQWPDNVIRPNVVLVRLNSVFPRPDCVLPRLDSALSGPDYVLSRRDSVLPNPEYILPTQNYVLPRPDAVLPRPDPVLPKPDCIIPRLKRKLEYVLTRQKSTLPRNATPNDSVVSRLPLSDYSIVMEEVPLEFCLEPS